MLWWLRLRWHGSIEIYHICLSLKALGLLLLCISNQYLYVLRIRAETTGSPCGTVESGWILKWEILHLKIMCHWAFGGMSFTDMGKESHSMLSRIYALPLSFSVPCKITSFRTAPDPNPYRTSASGIYSAWCSGDKLHVGQVPCTSCIFASWSTYCTLSHSMFLISRFS